MKLPPLLSLAAVFLLSSSKPATAEDIGGGINNATIVNGTPSPRVGGYAAVGPGACGGQLVHPDVVLTAGHCIGAFAVGTRVLISAISANDFVDERTIDAIVRHPNYVETYISPEDGLSDLANDIMLVRLNQRSNEPLATWATDTARPAAGDQVRIVGFGNTINGDDSSGSPVLLEAVVPTLSDAECQAEDPVIYKPATNTCSGGMGTGTCQGDSGSPVFAIGTTEIVGIVSYGIFCGADPGFFVRVAAYDAFITDTICTLSREPPAACGGSVCGDGVCTPGVEDETNCPADCTVPEPPAPPVFDGRCEVGNEINLAGLAGSSELFQIAVAAGENIACQMTGGNGDADLYMVRAKNTKTHDHTRVNLKSHFCSISVL